MVSALMIIAIIIGPIMAVQIQKLLERCRKKRQAKEGIFKTLMSTRGTPMALHHVQALNLIDIEFYGKKMQNVKVVDAWKLYRDHLYNCPRNTKDQNYSVNLDAWTKKTSEYLTELLFEMSQSLNYKFDRVLLKRGAYTPQGYGDAEDAQFYLRNKLVDLFEGKAALPVTLANLKGEQNIETQKPKQEGGKP